MDYNNMDDLHIEWEGNKVHIGPKEVTVRDFITEYLKPKLGVALREYLGTPEEIQREEAEEYILQNKEIGLVKYSI